MNRKKVSDDILHYFADKKGYSTEDIAHAVGASVKHVERIKRGLDLFTPDDIKNYLSNVNLQFWEFALEAINLDHLSEKSKNSVLFCRQLAAKIKKNRY